MTPKLRIAKKVLKRLLELKTTNTGRLFGVMSDNSLTVLGFALNPTDDDAIEPAALQLNMPVEIDLCGVLFIGDCKEDIPDAFKDIDITDNPLLIKYNLSNHQLEPYYYVHQTLKPAGELEVIDQDEIWEKFYYIRLKTSIPMLTQKNDIIEAFQTTRKNLASGNIGFHFPDSNTYLLGNDDESTEISLKNLSKKGSNELKKNSEANTRIIDAIDASMLIGMTSEKSIDGSMKFAPVLQQVTRPFESLQFNLNIDALSLVGHNLKASQLYSILVESVCRNTRLIERSIAQQLNNKDKFKVPELMHFRPKSCPVITISYPVGCTDDETKSYRKKLHKALALDLSKPLFCRGNAVKFSNDIKSNEPILRPHDAVPLPQGSISLGIVKGLYAYHHYMQDNFDDNGWGCAYRSFQTVFSWFKLQGFTQKNVPTHKEIQKCLVDIGDKGQNFIGSRQWIGSTEVGFVLETLLGISIKVLNARSGADMVDQFNSLKDHFDIQGTPVMIGGGVLAHTILGVSQNQDTDEIKFLILDPHYTGPENLTTIINKGWCAWKGMNFWKKDAFYNMCLPQRPSRY
ncbi:hypothetical protein HCN44_010311 [Aphidius gifuensis]|uniref:Probable Ufm1-specific protease 2 n=1 Tax=Aphidius gifuensis TaxID=684658 RepID=A0A834XVR7_APHGI|nr:ufm1-specific protease 2-like isoform X2 [Aphidius gifuensis]KAF7993716.1 hypothetical protein HCN44_010311 [Aphidius gifuensis]